MRSSKPLCDGVSALPLTRRAALRVGALGLGGLGLELLLASRAAAETAAGAKPASPKARSAIFIFLSGGLSQIDSFDPKPDGRAEIRGPFKPIETKTAGIQISEHLPLLAARSERWALCRSLTHPYNEHSQGHMAMLSGRTELPAGFDPNRPRRLDWPSVAAITNELLPAASALPPAMVLPERLVHTTGRVIPGQFAGLMGASRDPIVLEASAYNNKSYGAYPEYNFSHERGRERRANESFAVPQLALPAQLTEPRLKRRAALLAAVRSHQEALERSAELAGFRRYHKLALELLTEPSLQRAFDIAAADPAALERYGRNSFGWSLLMARQLIEAGVRLVQVNLGNNETWDTHVNAFHNLEKFLFPPADRALSALLDDLDERGLLSETLVVMAGEFGRTPRIFSIGKDYPPGRDHWGAVQTAWFAGGGIRGGSVAGSSDAEGGQPKDSPQKPENLAATIYHALGIPRSAHWTEQLGRPHPVYQAEPIGGLF
jgi:hypothetical protein